jgi:hypothetical protein
MMKSFSYTGGVKKPNMWIGRQLRRLSRVLALAGRFSNLANGLFFTSNGNNFKVNYTGGTGNDLTLKVVP